MTAPCFIHSLSGAICLLLVVLVPSVHGEEEKLPDPEFLPLPELWDIGNRLMAESRWEEALKYNRAAVKQHGHEAFKTHGPRFGCFYYRKGVCEMKLERFGEAMKSFEKCYKDFPNHAKDRAENPYEKTCLLQWAQSAMSIDEWQLALDLFDKFKKERSRKRDKMPYASFYVSRAICFYKLGKLVSGNENLEIALQNKARFKLSHELQMEALRHLMKAVIETGEEDSFVEFIDRNRGVLTLDPVNAHAFGGVFIRLAKDALSEELYRASLSILQLVPETELARHDAGIKLEQLGPLKGIREMDGTLTVKEQLATDIARFRKAALDGDLTEVYKLSALVQLHQEQGNFRGAYAACRLLNEYPQKHESKEYNLYNLARLSLLIDQGEADLKDVEHFTSLYPDSDYLPLLNNLMLGSLFAGGEFGECIRVATRMMESGFLKKGSQQHDLCLHVLGGSYYSMGEHEKAAKLLDEHVETYPDSESKVAAAYYQASNAYRMADHKRAIQLYGRFISRFPDPLDNPHLAYACFDKATSEYLLDRNDDALETVDFMLDKVQGSGLEAEAFNLRGHILVSLKKPLDAEASFRLGLRAAKRTHNRLMIGESLHSLVGFVLGPSQGAAKLSQPQLDAGMGYIDEFWKVCGEDAPHAPEMAVLQVPLLDQAGRLDQAIKVLEREIVRVANSDDSGRLQDLSMLDAYSRAFLQQSTAEKLKRKLLKFPGVAPGNKEVQALFLIQVIHVYEDVKRKIKTEQAVADAEANIDAVFERIKGEEFKKSDLSGHALVKVGDFLRIKTDMPREALPFYDEVIQREDGEFLHQATFGRAGILSDSLNPKDWERALADFRSLIAEAGETRSRQAVDKKRIEDAKRHVIELLLRMKDHDRVIQEATAFLDKDKGHLRCEHAPYVWVMLAKAYEAKGLVKEAMAAYSKAWGGHQGLIRVSAPSLKRWMEMRWDRNQQGDRQAAYDAGARFLKTTGHFEMVESDLAQWKEVEDLTNLYVAHPQVKSLEQQERDKKP